MTETTQSPEEKQAEFDALKDKATMLGVSFHPSISEEKLRARIKEKEDADKAEAKVMKTYDKKDADDPLALVRVRVTCMDPAKRKHTGELITCGNTKIGTLRRMVPFGVEWHIPRIMLNVMRDKKFRMGKTIKQNGREVNVNEFVPAFAIEVLPQLSKEELKDLAQRQAMASGTTEE